MLFAKSRPAARIAAAPDMSRAATTAELTMNILLNTVLPLFLSLSLGGSAASGDPCCPCCPPECCAPGCCEPDCCDPACCPPGCCETSAAPAASIEASKPAATGCCTTGSCR